MQLKLAFGGSIVAPILTRTVPAMATVRPGIFPLPVPQTGRRAVTEHLSITGPFKPGTRVLEHRALEIVRAVELAAATVIGVGMGIGGLGQLPLIESLARALGAAIGASRKVVDHGWLPRQLQIGLTGKSISPKLYLAVALRGNLNHMIGVKRAKFVVAVNKDPDAEVFQSSDVGIVADFRDFIPALIKAVQRRASCG